MSVMQEHELESEFEHELHETESEHEGLLGSIVGGLLGEGEATGEHEFEHEHEHELEHELEGELELEGEFEFEAGEQFFGSIGKFLRRAAPVVKQVARAAAPIVGTAIGGPFGTALGGLASNLLREHEHELEHEHEHELEGESELELETETEHESEHEVAHEIAAHEATMHEALAEMMAEAASHEQHEGHAEAMVGASVVTVLSPRDHRALSHLLPHLVKGAAVLTRILRRRRITRPAVRAVPTIMRRTVRALKRQAAAGRPITRRLAARAAAGQVRRVLGNPRALGAAVSRNMRCGRAVRRRRPRFGSVRG
jgi:hypothetical protein